MAKLERQDLWTLEDYAQRRNAFRQEIIAEKRHRQLPLGDHARLYFENELTIRYQIQEMLRIEKVFDPEGIQDELDAYNPLIPDGSNWKATFMMEYPDVEQRKEMLARLVGIEARVWVQVDGFDAIWPIADEDLERSTDEKTSSVHFMRWELDPSMVAALRQGATLYAGIDHANYAIARTRVPDNIRNALVTDLADIRLQ